MSDSESAHIAIVEDDPDQLCNYRDALQRRGYSVSSYGKAETALEEIPTHPPDLVILDVVLGPNRDGGFDLCKALLDQGTNLPVIFLTDRTDEIDQVFGLRLGAWDYQTKPISLTLLAERVTRILSIARARRAPEPVDGFLETGSLRIDAERVISTWNGEPVPLTITECRLLEAIIRGKEAGASYADLAQVTLQRRVTDNAINTHIRNIRNKFRKIDQRFDCIQTVHRRGYRWVTD